MINLANKSLIYKRWFFVALGMVLLTVPLVVFAQTNGGLANLSGNVNLGMNLDLIQTIGKLINIFLSILGVIALLIILYGGITWLLSRGNPEQVAKAKKIISGGIIGLIIILSAFALASFIFNKLSEAINGKEGGPTVCPDGTPPPCLGTFPGSEYLRVTTFNPTQDKVPLCRAVQAGFNYPVVLTASAVDSSTFRIEKEDGTLFYSATDKYDPNTDSDFYAFRHAGHEFEKNTKYHVVISNLQGVNKEGNLLPFRNPALGKEWWFTTGDQTDNTAPWVVTKQPNNGDKDVCRRIVIGATFNETMLMSSFKDNVILEKLRIDNTVEAVIPLSKPVFTNDIKTVSYNPVDTEGRVIALAPNSTYRVTLKGGSSGITDACEIPLTTEASCTGAYAPCVSWQFTTGETENCEPIIDNITPAQGYYNDEITLTGKNFFTLPGEVYFNNFAASNNSFDGSTNLVCWGAADCGTAEDTIKVRVPVGATTGPAYPQDDYDITDIKPGKVKISIANTFSNEQSPFTIQSPYIDSLTPTSGGHRQWVSAIGWNFGSNPGQVLFGTTPGNQPGMCANWWSETEALVEIPDSLNLNTYPVELRTVTGRRSNQDWVFTVNNNPPGPGICSISPTIGKISGTPPPDILPLDIEVTGKNFGDSKKSTSKLVFNANANALSLEADYTKKSFSWNNDQIIAGTPIISGNNALGIGRWDVCAKARIDGKDLTSNCKSFTVKDESSIGVTNKPPQVVSYSECKVETPSPSPKLGIDNVCTNARVLARFTLPMDETTLNNSNIKLWQCNSGSENFNSNSCTTEVPYNLTYQLNSDGIAQGFILDPNFDLQNNYWYQAEINNQVKSIYDVRMSLPYSWHWKTIKSGNCLIDHLLVMPAEVNLSVGDSHDPLTGNVFTSDCIALNPKDYGWVWGENDVDNHITTFPSSSGKIYQAGVRGDSTTTTPAEVIASIKEAPGKDARSLITVSGAGSGNLLGPPKISSMTPNSGRAEKDIFTVITINGSDFGSSGSIYFTNETDPTDRVKAPLRKECIGTWTNNTIIITTPILTGTNYKVEVVTSKGTSAANPLSAQPVFTVTNEVKPGICSMVPDYGPTGTSITIKGHNFSDTKQAGELLFPYDIYASGPLNKNLITEWTNKEIIYKVPPRSHSGNVIVGVDITTDDGYNPSWSNPWPYYGEPFITDIIPNTGPAGTWVTIRGKNFGNCSSLEITPGEPCSVTFTNSSGIAVSAEPLPDICRSVNIWTDTEIVVKVPALGSGEFTSMVTVYTDDPPRLTSNSKEFYYNSNLPLGPSLCGLSPDGTEPANLNISVNLLGDRFGATKVAGSKINFTNVGDISNNWSNSLITTTQPLPANIASGDVKVEKTLSILTGRACNFPKIKFGDICIGGWDPVYENKILVSNPRYFTVGTAGTGADVDMIVTSFEPANKETNVCRNTQIIVSFAALDGGIKEVAAASVTKDTFKVLNKTIPIDGSFKISGNKIIFTPSQNLEANTAYTISLTGGVDGIKARDGASLNCTSSTCQSSFFTSANICSLAKLTVTPSSYSYTQKDEQKDFQAQAWSKDDQPINATYTWQAEPTDLINIQPTTGQSVTAVTLNKNGAATLKVTATGIAPITGSLTTSAALDIFICEVPWEYVDSQYHYRLRYCLLQTSTENKNKLINGSFDTNLNPWTASSAGWSSVTPPSSPPGPSTVGDDNVLSLTQARTSYINRSVMQTINNLETDTVYYASTRFYLPPANNGTAAILFITKNSNCDFGQSTSIVWQSTNNTASNWQNLATTFNTGDNTSLTLCLAAYNNSGVLNQPVYFDNVKVSKLTNALPGLKTVIDSSQEKLFSVPGTKDVIGIKSFNNPDHLIPADWLKTREEGKQAQVTATTLDGYPAGRGGQTMYVSSLHNNGGNCAVNEICGDEHLLSINIGASSVSQDIYNQLLANWQFNINLTSEDKGKLQRDNQRLADLNIIKKYLEQYGRSHKYTIPQLPAGTYIAKWSTSAWNSWQETLGAALGKNLPRDPLNSFNSCTVSGFDPTTCWSESTKQFNCPADSHIYMYRAVDASTARLYFNPEFTGVIWKDSAFITTPDPSSICTDSDIMWSKVSVEPPFTLNVASSSLGVVTSEDGSINCGTKCSNIYSIGGQQVKLTAQAKAGAVFAGWSGCTSVEQGNCFVIMDSDNKHVTADFTSIATYTLTVSRGGSGSGKVTAIGISCGDDCTQDYNSGSNVTLTAEVSPGSLFLGWSGCTSVEGADGTQCRVTMNSNKSIAARFGLLYNLTANHTGEGTVTFNPSGLAACGANCNSYLNGTVVNLTANPGADQVFKQWNNCPTPNGIICTVTVNNSLTVTAEFEPQVVKYNLNVSLLGTGTGLVTSTSPDSAINCGVTCSASYTRNQTVTLLALSGVGSQFSSWGGACSGSYSTCNITMDNIKNVTAEFNLKQYNLTVLIESGDVSGVGKITSYPAGIDCPKDCREQFNYGQLVILTPEVFDEDYEFTGWSSDSNLFQCGGTSTCTITIPDTTVAMNITGHFAARYQLTVEINTSLGGLGRVTSNPSGIDCGSTCISRFSVDEPVTLYAIPNSGSFLSSWSFNSAAVSCSSNNTCQFTYNNTTPLKVIANFDDAPTTYKLNVAVTSGGEGAISGSGINCSTSGDVTCSNNYPVGQNVTLTATPSTGYSFVKWLGDCSGSLTYCTVTMDGNRNVTAEFTPRTYDIIVKPPDNGRIIDNSGNINCDGDPTNPTNKCSGTYNYGSQVSLTAIPNTGYVFDHWSYKLEGWSNYSSCATNPCTFTIYTADIYVSGLFSLPKYNFTLQKSPSILAGSVTVNDYNCDFNDNCSSYRVSYDYNTHITLTATPNTGYVFNGWSGDVCNGSTSTTCEFDITADTLVTANFVSILRTLQVNINPAGFGRVNSSGINCPADCSETFPDGTSVTLIASPLGGNSFINWTDVTCNEGSTSQSCSFLMNSNITATANFVSPVCYTLTTIVSPAGSGSVSVSPANSTGCSTGQYTAGQVIGLTATANTGYTFVNWSGGPTGIAVTRFTMPAANTTVTANFKQIQQKK